MLKHIFVFAHLFILATFVVSVQPSLAQAQKDKKTDAKQTPQAEASEENAKPAVDPLRQLLDDYLDRRWLPADEAGKATDELVEKLNKAGCTAEKLEGLLRAGRCKYEPVKTADKLALVKGLACEHVDYKTAFFLYVPKTYNPDKAAPLLLVGHGGNSAMSPNYAAKAALGGIMPWLPVVTKNNMILAAPLSERGWGPIGNSLLLSLISHLQRRLNIDPDRIYITGHSMGGHLSWRSGISLADRWGAISPMSGGYDYIEKKQIASLFNVPGYSTFGAKEPYNINPYNKKIAKWMAEHDYDWKLVEKPGGHEIYADELPKVAQFLLSHPRNLYRDRVYGTAGKSVVFNSTWKIDKWPKHTWNPERPIQRSTFHWIRMFAQPQDTPKEQSPQRLWAENLGNNRIQITSQFVRQLRVYLHPKMVDFSKPVEIVVNGKTVFKKKVKPELKTMLELVREFDDRGRIFHAAVDLQIDTDAKVPEPRGKPAEAGTGT